MVCSPTIDRSGCGYLADLVTCVHIIQLKSLTCMRVGSKQKKVDIDVPQLNEFIHKVYVHCARKLLQDIGRWFAQATLDLRKIRVRNAGKLGQITYGVLRKFSLLANEVANIGRQSLEYAPPDCGPRSRNPWLSQEVLR